VTSVLEEAWKEGNEKFLGVHFLNSKVRASGPPMLKQILFYRICSSVTQRSHK